MARRKQGETKPGREKRMRSMLEKRTRSGCLTSTNNETIRPSQCLGKRACGARVGVSSAANK